MCRRALAGLVNNWLHFTSPQYPSQRIFFTFSFKAMPGVRQRLGLRSKSIVRGFAEVVEGQKNSFFAGVEHYMHSVGRAPSIFRYSSTIVLYTTTPRSFVQNIDAAPSFVSRNHLRDSGNTPPAHVVSKCEVCVALKRNCGQHALRNRLPARGNRNWTGYCQETADKLNVGIVGCVAVFDAIFFRRDGQISNISCSSPFDYWRDHAYSYN
jgi:hypothetical protein